MKNIEYIRSQEPAEGLSIVDVLRSIAVALDTHFPTMSRDNKANGAKFWQDLTTILIKARLEWGKS